MAAVASSSSTRPGWRARVSEPFSLNATGSPVRASSVRYVSTL